MYILQIAFPDETYEAIDVTKIVRLRWYDGYTTIFCQDGHAVRVNESLAAYQERVLKVETMKNQCHLP